MTVALLIMLAPLTLPVAILTAEVLLAVVYARRTKSPPERLQGANIAVVVPAHDESIGIRSTLLDAKMQLRPGDRILVVADNCSDDTAAVARQLGVEVIERTDDSRRGKGFALQFAVDHLAQSTIAPSVVIFVDADCRIENGAFDYLASSAIRTGRPAQAHYDMLPHVDAGSSQDLALFAWRVRNWVRPTGLAVLGLPCQLMGTGMACPWPCIKSISLATSHLTEDLQLGLELAVARQAPMFCPSAKVTSVFPRTSDAAAAQRQRWEQGHLQLMGRAAINLWHSLVHLNFPLLVLSLDVLVPPIALLVVALSGFWLLAGVAWLAGISSPLPMLLASGAFATLAASLIAAWLLVGDNLTLRGVGSRLASHLWRKTQLYSSLARGQKLSSWVRTSRK